MQIQFNVLDPKECETALLMIIAAQGELPGLSEDAPCLLYTSDAADD